MEVAVAGETSEAGGDAAKAFAAVVAEFGPAVERLTRGYERAPEARRDLAQEIWVAVWRALPTFEGRASMRTFVFRVAHNVAVTHVLRSKRAHTSQWVSIEALGDVAAPGDAERAAGARRDVERLAELVRSLKPIDRQLVLLYLEGVDVPEMAEVTGLSATNVTTKLSRIRAALRAHLGGGAR